MFGQECDECECFQWYVCVVWIDGLDCDVFCEWIVVEYVDECVVCEQWVDVLG